MKIPNNIDEAVDILLSQMSEKDKESYRQEPEDYPGVCFHFGGGMNMRNSWGLWFNDTAISQWMDRNEIYHGDDRSSTIYKALWCRLTGKPFDIKKEAAFHRAYWEKGGTTWEEQKAFPRKKK